MTPTNSSLAKRHPNWLTIRRNSSKVSIESVNQPTATNPKLEKVADPTLTKGVWLNPFHPEVQQFMLNMIVEVVSKYDVDGIQFDDRFGLPSDFGYDEYTIALYKQEHQGKNPPDNPLDAPWLRWRADKLTSFMQRVYKAVKAVKPNCLVTLVSQSPRLCLQSDFTRLVYLGQPRFDRRINLSNLPQRSENFFSRITTNLPANRSSKNSRRDRIINWFCK